MAMPVGIRTGSPPTAITSSFGRQARRSKPLAAAVAREGRQAPARSKRTRSINGPSTAGPHPQPLLPELQIWKKEPYKAAAFWPPAVPVELPSGACGTRQHPRYGLFLAGSEERPSVRSAAAYFVRDSAAPMAACAAASRATGTRYGEHDT